MERIFCGVRGLFCVCLAVAAVLVLGQCGWAAALTLAACAWALWKKPLPHFTAWLFAGGLLLRVVILLLLHPPIISDFELLLWAARAVFCMGRIRDEEEEGLGDVGSSSNRLKWSRDSWELHS